MSTNAQENFLEAIKKEGIVVTHVADGEMPGIGYPYSYTTGLYAQYRRPEIIICGMSSQMTHQTLHAMHVHIRNGANWFETGKLYDTIFKEFQVTFIEVSEAGHAAHLHWATWYYQTMQAMTELVPAIQMVWPATTTKAFPWQPGWPEELNAFQPLLGPPPANLAKI
ncbi:MAG: hypothetical protein CMK09_11195 [Ponticaulis sp.]|nr:hypothetical protein [Ponticaulis sp.]|tara:strand:- start:71667 stop:72167 length:501 start_codon:yes stop_codon:yes gene_type:complete